MSYEPRYEMPPPRGMVRVNRNTLCQCGKRRGMHRWGDESCPNQAWRPGNGQDEWRASTFTPWQTRSPAA